MTGTSRFGKMSRGIRNSAAPPVNTSPKTTTMMVIGLWSAARIMSIFGIFPRRSRFPAGIRGTILEFSSFAGARGEGIDRSHSGLGHQFELRQVEAGDCRQTPLAGLVGR